MLYKNVAKAGDTIFGTQPVDADSVLANPLFTNATNGDYTLKSNSPAFTVGFNPAGVPLAQ